MYHHVTALRFECTGCGKCCLGNEDNYVRLSAAEAERIRLHLGLSKDWFRRRYLVRLEPGLGRGLALRDGRCVFLGEDLRCSIYPVRPTQCRTYPFWPEVLRSRGAWKAEAKRCEGIDRGNTIEVRLVDRQLRRQLDAEADQT